MREARTIQAVYLHCLCGYSHPYHARERERYCDMVKKAERDGWDTLRWNRRTGEATCGKCRERDSVAGRQTGVESGE